MMCGTLNYESNRLTTQYPVESSLIRDWHPGIVDKPVE